MVPLSADGDEGPVSDNKATITARYDQDHTRILDDLGGVFREIPGITIEVTYPAGSHQAAITDFDRAVVDLRQQMIGAEDK